MWRIHMYKIKVDLGIYSWIPVILSKQMAIYLVNFHF